MQEHLIVKRSLSSRAHEQLHGDAGRSPAGSTALKTIDASAMPRAGSLRGGNESVSDIAANAKDLERVMNDPTD